MAVAGVVEPGFEPVLAHTAGVVLLEHEPLWPPGQDVGESALLYGHLLGELVRRTDGRSLGRFLRDEVCGPHDLDFHVGLADAELSRAVDLTGFDAAAWRRSEVPAVNGHGTARSVAGLYVALRHAGLLSDRSLVQMLTPTGVGFDRVVGSEVSWGLGVGLDPDGFGMGGTGGSFGWWSEPGGYALGFVTGHVADHGRGDRVEDAVRQVLGLAPA